MPDILTLRQHFEKIDSEELVQRLAQHALTPEAAQVVREVLKERGELDSTLSPTDDATTSAKTFAEEEKRAQALWKGWMARLIFIMGAITAWNVGRAVAAQLFSVHLGALYSFALLPVGYILARSVVKPVLANPETSYKDKHSFLIAGLIGGFLLLSASGAWMSAVLPKS